MKSALLPIIAGLFILFGCETDINVIEPSKPVPVVYCILNQDSDVQYLSLTRSYITEDATIPPQEQDSILFARATKIAVEEIIGGEVSRRLFFSPYEVKKDSGFFPSTERWAYRAEFKVKPETDYRLIIYIDAFEKIAYSTCFTVGDFNITNPVYPEVRYIHMLPDHNLSFYWTKSRNAAIYQLGFVMHYLEMGDETLEKEILIPLKSIFYLSTTNNLFTYPVNSTNFYTYLAQSLTVDPGLLRKCESIDAVIISGGEELGYYMRTQESGQAFSLMDYSNIQNGIGIFSSKVVRRINGFKLTEQSIDSLAYGQFTRDLNFVDRSGTRKDITK
jgi:hypothetical protein